VNTSHSCLCTCLREPIPEIFDAARCLDAAVVAHLAGDRVETERLIRVADDPRIAQWTESLWGRGGPWMQLPRPVPDPPPYLKRNARPLPRMPTAAQRAQLLARDGHHCRFCGIPLIRAEVRRRFMDAYPDAARWGRRNVEQHAAFQAMWVQYDHILPNARGGATDLSNLVITCAPCNFGRTDLTLEEVGLLDPRSRPPIRSAWDGLERFRP
jgi:5-methylcytosine-specific restriction endonuclease McrA